MLAGPRQVLWGLFLHAALKYCLATEQTAQVSRGSLCEPGTLLESFPVQVPRSYPEAEG